MTDVENAVQCYYSPLSWVLFNKEHVHTYWWDIIEQNRKHKHGPKTG